MPSGAGKRQSEDQVLSTVVKAAFDRSDQTYGAGRIVQELRGQGTRVRKNRVWRLMKQHGLRVKTTKRFKVTTSSEHKRQLAPNLVQRCFSAGAPDRLWTGDITCIWTAEGWMYLAVVVVLDVFSRRIVGWSMDKRITNALSVPGGKRKEESFGTSKAFTTDNGGIRPSVIWHRKTTSGSSPKGPLRE